MNVTPEQMSNIIDKFESMGGHAWEAAVRQVRVELFSHGLVVLVLSVLYGVTLAFLLRRYREARSYAREDWFVALVFIGGLGGLMLLIYTTVFLLFAGTAIFNPKWAAIEMLVHAVS